MRQLPILSLSLLLFLSLIVPATSIAYCSSVCNTCTSPYPSDCLTCNPLLTMSSGSCSAITQTSIFTQELMMYKTFTPSGYSSNSTLSVVKCIGSFDYYMLGTLGTGSYVSKKFTGLGVNHYQVSVLYGYALLGSTAWTQQLSLQIVDGTGSSTSDLQTPVCAATTLSGCLYTAGCFASYSVSGLVYSSDSLTLNFSLTAALSAGQAWAIRDIVIILALCDSSCATCSSNTPSTCLTCAAGLYFSGTLCVSACPFYTLPDTGKCVTSCPVYYFLNSVNNYCEPCPTGCSACTASDQCLSWTTVQTTNLFTDLIAVWIILIILGLLIIGLLIWKFCLARKSFYNAMQEDVIDHKPAPPEPAKVAPMNQSHQLMETHWIQDIDDLHMTKAKKRPPKDSIAGIGKTTI